MNEQRQVAPAEARARAAGGGVRRFVRETAVFTTLVLLGALLAILTSYLLGKFGY